MIDGQSIFTDACGFISGTPVPNIVRQSNSGTYTPAASGMVTMEILNFRGGDYTSDIKNYIDDIHVVRQNPTLTISNPEQSASAAAVFNFQVDMGPAYAGNWVLMLQGVTGTYPGFDKAGGAVHVPLNPDFWTFIALDFNQFWPGFYGPLDANGQSTPTLNTFSAQPSATGLAIYLAGVVLQSASPPVLGATSPVHILFLP